MGSLRNPFRFGGEIGADDLVDRQEETALVERTIRNGDKLFLIGPRRYGKTSILRTASERLSSRGAIVLRVDADPVSSLSALAEEILMLSASRLKGKTQQIVDQMREYFSRVRPELKFDVTEHRWTVSLGVQGSPEPVAQLVEVLHGLEKMAQAQPATRPVGLIIDEFQHVIELGGERAEAQLRSAVQRHSRVGYVFAGSDTHMLTAMTMNADRPFYRLGKSHNVGPVPRKDFSEFIAASMKESGFSTPDPDAIERILILAEDVPYNVQSLANSCWEELLSMRGASSPALSTEVVDKALLRAVMELDPFYTTIWTRLTPVQQNALRAIIIHEGKGLMAAAVVRTIGATGSTVHRAVESLHKQKILRDEAFNGGLRIRFDDPFFAHWIRMRALKLSGPELERRAIKSLKG